MDRRIPPKSGDLIELDGLRGMDKQQFEQMFRRHRGAVRGVLYPFCTDGMELEDLVQETMQRAWERREQFRGESMPSTWACAIARNVGYNHLRDKSRQPELVPYSHTDYEDENGVAESWLEQNSIDYDSPEQLVAAAELAEEISIAAEGLGGILYTVYQLHWEAGLSPQEIAAKIGLSADTVRRYISRVREKLQS